MAVNIPAVAVVGTKLADGNVRLDLYASNDGVNPSADIRFAVVIPAADFTSFNTTVNGGSTGATLTKVYAQDQFRGDYVNSMAFET